MIARWKSRGMSLDADPAVVALEIRANEQAATEILAMLTGDHVERPADPWAAPLPRTREEAATMAW
jgi:hypothetical protein